MLDDRGRSDCKVRLDRINSSKIIFKRGAIDDLYTAAFQPSSIISRPWRFWTRRADIRHISTTFDQKARDQQLGALIARKGDSAVNPRARERAFDRRQEGVLRGGNLVRFDVVGVTN